MCEYTSTIILKLDKAGNALEKRLIDSDLLDRVIRPVSKSFFRTHSINLHCKY